MLESLNNQIVGAYRLRVEMVGRARYFDQRDFALYLVDARGNAFVTPVFRGKFNAGRPSIYVPSWIDGEFVEDQPTLSHTLFTGVAQRLGALIQPGGRLWFAYEAFGNAGAMMRETRDALDAHVPLIATPIGFLLFRADCWCGLRDWDIPEGGREGPRKLQGNKPLHAAHARQRAGEIVQTLEQFLGQRVQLEIAARAQARAQVILPALRLVVGKA